MTVQKISTSSIPISVFNFLFFFIIVAFLTDIAQKTVL